MKRINRFLSVLMCAFMLLGYASMSASANTTASLADYEAVLYEVAEEFNLLDKAEVSLTGLPDVSLEEFERNIRSRFAILTDSLVEVPENAIPGDTNGILPRTSIGSHLPSDEERNGWKYCAVYFRVYCIYYVGYREKAGKEIVTDVMSDSIIGGTTLIGALNSFTFEQKKTYYVLKSDGSADVYAEGDWIDNKNMVRVVYLANYAIIGNFTA